LLFLSLRYNEGLPVCPFQTASFPPDSQSISKWSDNTVVASLCLVIIGAVAFLVTELCLAREPVLAPFMLKQKIPVLVGLSGFLVSLCTFTIIYFFPLWFQTVMMTSASTAGKNRLFISIIYGMTYLDDIGWHLVPNSMAIPLGSLFAGYMMHKTGRYKTMNLTLGWLPFIGAMMISSLRFDSPPLFTWVCIVCLNVVI